MSVNGYVKCRSCKEKFWVEMMKLDIGFYKDKDEKDYLPMYLDEVTFKVKCNKCNEVMILSVVIIKDEQPKIEVITDNPNYIG